MRLEEIIGLLAIVLVVIGALVLLNKKNQPWNVTAGTYDPLLLNQPAPIDLSGYPGAGDLSVLNSLYS